VLDDIRQSLGADEVGGQLEGRGEAAVRHVEVDGDARLPRQLGESRVQPAFGERPRPDAVRQISKLGSARRDLVDQPAQRRGRFAVRVRGQPLEACGHLVEPCLRPAVELLAQAPPLLVARLEQPAP
jgi:hypothetical protein